MVPHFYLCYDLLYFEQYSENNILQSKIDKIFGNIRKISLKASGTWIAWKCTGGYTGQGGKI